MDDDKVVVTFRDVYDKFIEFTVELRLLRQEYQSDKSIKEDHEKRIRELEAWKYGLPVAFLTAVAGIVIALVEG